jgi:hypothetical protein
MTPRAYILLSAYTDILSFFGFVSFWPILISDVLGELLEIGCVKSFTGQSFGDRIGCWIAGAVALTPVFELPLQPSLRQTFPLTALLKFKLRLGPISPKKLRNIV